jgi:DNA mismatch repair ATPase MutS
MYNKLKSLFLKDILNIEKKNKKKDKNLETDLSNIEKYTIIFNLFENIYKNDHKTTTNETFYTDLNVFNDNSVFNAINKTKTIFGEIKLGILLYSPIDDIIKLQKRQNIIKQLSLVYKNINPILNNIKKRENDILWLLKEKNEEETEYINSVYCTNNWLKWVNNSSFLLNLIHYYNVIFTPFSALVSPFISIILAFIIFRFVLGIKIGIFKFYRCFKMGLNSSFSFLGPQYEMISQIIYFILYIVSGYKSIVNSQTRMDKCKLIHKKLSSVHCLLDSIVSINLILKKIGIFEYFWNSSLEKDLNIIKENFNISRNYKFFQNWGNVLITFSKLDKYRNNISNLMYFIGNIDSMLSITKIKMKKQVCFTNFLKESKPLININGMLHPILINKNPILNDLNLQNNKNILLFGPNASGKSLLIKSLVLNVLLSQTLTISCANNMDITPFSVLNTYLNIPDIVGKESLFEAEVHRCKDYISRIKNLSNNKFALTIFDELFSSTNYYEGLSTSYAICKYLSKYSNCINIITTHFHKLCKLEREGAFKCYKMKITQEKDGKIEFHYKLKRGISKKKLAIELLRMKGLDKEIIDCALKFYDKMFKIKKKIRIEKKNILINKSNK